MMRSHTVLFSGFPNPRLVTQLFTHYYQAAPDSQHPYVSSHWDHCMHQCRVEMTPEGITLVGSGFGGMVSSRLS